MLLILFMPNLVQAKDVVNIAFAIDNNYVIPTMVALDSIFKSSSSTTKYNFYVLESGLTKHSKELMSKQIEKGNHNVSFISIDDNVISDWEGLNVIAPIIIARILIPDLLPKEVEKVIYMDTDIFVTADLAKLYNIDLEFMSTGMVKDFSEAHLSKLYAPFGFKFTHGYYNAGIMLMDLKKWRNMNLSRRIFETMYANPQMYKEVPLADQNVISEVVGPTILPLDLRWNNQCYLSRCKFISDNDGAIYHYTIDKPWNRLINFELSEAETRYLQHWKNSPYKYYIYHYLLKFFEKVYKSKISMDNIKEKYLRYIEVFKKSKTYVQYPLWEFDYIINGK